MQPPAGPPVWTALNARPSTIPPPMSYTISRSVVPIGTSTRPVFTTRPARAKTFVPLLVAVPIAANQSPPLRMMGATLANVSTLLMSVGRSHRPAHAGYGGRGRGVPASALDRGDERGLLAAHEGAGPEADVDLEGELGVQDGRAEVAAAAGLADRLAESRDRERVLGSAVDVACLRADRVGGDRHPLQHPVRVALEDAPVHERAGVALVGVADDVLAGAGRLGDGVPFQARRVAGAAAAAQAALRDLVAHLGGGHRREHVAERRVAVGCDVVLEALGIDAPGVLRRDPRPAARRTDASGHPVGTGGHCAERIDDRPQRVGPDVAEELAGLRDLDERSGGAQPEATDPLDGDVRHAVVPATWSEPCENVVRRGGQAAHGLADVRGCADRSLGDEAVDAASRRRLQGGRASAARSQRSSRFSSAAGPDADLRPRRRRSPRGRGCTRRGSAP